MIKISDPHLLFAGQKYYRKNSLNSIENGAKKRVVVVFSSKEHDLSQTAQLMMNKLLAACKVKENEVVFINNNFSKYSLATLQINYSPEYVLLFGETACEGNLSSLKLYKGYELAGMYIVKSIQPDDLVKNDKQKLELWKALQQVFKL